MSETKIKLKNGENVSGTSELTGTGSAESVKQPVFQPYRFNDKIYTEEKKLRI